MQKIQIGKKGKTTGGASTGGFAACEGAREGGQSHWKLKKGTKGDSAEELGSYFDRMSPYRKKKRMEKSVEQFRYSQDTSNNNNKSNFYI